MHFVSNLREWTESEPAIDSCVTLWPHDTPIRMSKERTAKVRVTKATLDEWRRAAKSAGLTLSEWVRLRCDGVRTINVPAPKER